MPTQYRDKKPVLSTVGSDQRVAGRFAITGAVVGSCRPSAGATAVAGAGNVYTVSVPTAGSAAFQVTLVEGYYLPIAPDVQVLYPFNTTLVALPTATVQVFASPVDTTTNSFMVYVVNAAGTVLTAATTPTAAAALPAGCFVGFELISKGSVSPPSL